MRETDKGQVAQVLLKDHYSDNNLEEVKLSHALTNFILSEKVENSIEN